MEHFRNAQVVRLRLHRHPFPYMYLVANDDKETVFLEKNGFTKRAEWFVEFGLNSNSDSVFRLKSCYGKYIAASHQPSLPGMTGGKVLQSLPSVRDSSLELEAVMEGGPFTLRTHYGTFLRTNDDHSLWPYCVTHDLPYLTPSLWDVDVLKKAEGSATNIDDKSLEGRSATKSHHESGKGSLVTESPPRNSSLIRESDEVRYRRHFWKLKGLLLNPSGNDVLVRGGTGMTALVREVCADVSDHYDTIAWISIPHKSDFELIPGQMLLQLIFERVAFPENFDRKPWMLRDHGLSLQPMGGCLIVVDNLDDRRTLKKLEEVLREIEECQVILIARHDVDFLYGREFKTYELEDLSYAPRAYHLKDFLDKRFPVPSKEVCQLIVKKCERLPAAIVFILRDQMYQNEGRPFHSAEIIKDQWEARIPSVKLTDELHVIQKVLKTLYKDLHEGESSELDHIQRVLEVLFNNDLRFCLLYLGILPQYSQISCKRVSRLWAAEGLLLDLGRADRFFNDLLDKECIHPWKKKSDGELSTFRMDKHARKIIVSLSNLSDLVTTTSQGSADWPESARYLSVRGKIRLLNEESTFELSTIFALNVSSNENRATASTTTSRTPPLETCETSLVPFNLKHSKVLDLTDAPFQIVPDAKFGLTEARYLILRNKLIKSIPGSIRELKHLEFLDAKHSLVTKLPSEFEGHEKIRHILIYHHEKDPKMESYNLIGFEALCSVGGLKCLEKLCFVESKDSILEDLVNLTNLRRLGITKLRQLHGKSLCSSLEKLEQLESLNLHAFDQDEILDLHHFSKSSSPLVSLKRLYLHGRLDKLPDWISSLCHLTKIVLRWSQLVGATQQEKDLLAIFGKLPKLVELKLHRAYNARQLDFQCGQFPKLKILVLDELEVLRSMSLEMGTMPSLNILTISRCQWLERIPSGIEHIPTIRKLTFFDMSREFYKMAQAGLEKGYYQYLEHIPKVYFTRWQAGHWETHQVESTAGEVEESTEEELEESTDEDVEGNEEEVEESADEDVKCYLEEVEGNEEEVEGSADEDVEGNEEEKSLMKRWKKALKKRWKKALMKRSKALTTR